MSTICIHQSYSVYVHTYISPIVYNISSLRVHSLYYCACFQVTGLVVVEVNVSVTPRQLATDTRVTCVSVIPMTIHVGAHLLR